MVDMDYQTREAVSALLERVGRVMMDAKRACIDKSRREVHTFYFLMFAREEDGLLC